MEVLKRRADEFVAMKERRDVDRCWDLWRRTAELKSAERIIAERVGARIVKESVVLWRQRTYARSYVFLTGTFTYSSLQT